MNVDVVDVEVASKLVAAVVVAEPVCNCKVPVEMLDKNEKLLIAMGSG